MAALLSWNEIKARANIFAREWLNESRERAESQSFWNDFFEVFGVTRRRYVTFERHVRRHSSRSGWGNIDAFWPGTILIEQKSAGEDLDAAYEQATDYFAGIPERDLPRAVVVCDFDRFRFYDLDSDSTQEFGLSEFADHVELFGFLAGYERAVTRDEVPANREAAEIMGELHDTLAVSGYGDHPLEVLLVRILFCLFAEDTGIFEKGIFQEFIETRTSEDGSDTGARLTELFQVLNVDYPVRQRTLDETLNLFPYVNGGLFREILPMPAFDSAMREKLLDACAFRWSEISPAIFGAMFQSIMKREERRNLGAHYTPEPSILKLINPLFLNSLRAEFEHLKALRVGKIQRLERFHEKLAAIILLDPACGCGNFLVVAYRELRNLETDILKELLAEGQTVLDVSLWVKISVDQMAGIELEEWPARIAETALWLTDHQANRKLLELGQVFVRLPLRASPNIVVGNALEIDWHGVVDRTRVSYVFGNPPFAGKRYQSRSQRSDMSRVFRGLAGSTILDYVTAWYVLAAQFCQGTRIECAFVSTNSISQGEQVAPLWNTLNRYGVRRNFAHRTFKWTSEGRGTAAVHVVIIGFASFDREAKNVVDYPDISGEGHSIPCQSINAYLVPDGADVIVASRRRPWEGVMEIAYGNMANDDQNLALSSEQLAALRASGAQATSFARRYVKRFLGSEEFINGLERYCLWLVDATPTEIRSVPEVNRRVQAVRTRRLASTREATNELANRAALFAEIRQPTQRYLFIPGVSSENRRYVPMAFMDADVILSDLARSIEGAGIFEFGILNSAMHMAWLRNVGGRLKSDYRYSCSLVYNTFVWPSDVSPTVRAAVESAAQAVLDVRLRYPNETFEALYDPATMPADLATAHTHLDRAVDRAYRRQPFRGEIERIIHLFDLYAAAIAGAQLTLESTPPRRRRQTRP